MSYHGSQSQGDCRSEPCIPGATCNNRLRDAHTKAARLPHEDSHKGRLHMKCTQGRIQRLKSSSAQSQPFPIHDVNLQIQCESKVSRGTCLVKMSAGFLVPNTLYSEKSPFRSLSCTHNWPVSRCLPLPVPALLHIPIAAEESACILRSVSRPRSAERLFKPRASVAPFTIPVSSASPELSVSTFCVEDQCLIR